jgi:acyl-CoA synthetase (AMP-forming)/AMP-acid ligase II
MPDLSFARAWRTVARLAPEREAIVCGERRLTYGDIDDRSRRLAAVLAEHGVGEGDKVAIECVNAPEYVEAFHAAQLLGAVPVNVNYRYTGSELAYLLDNSDAAALVFHDEFGASVADALDALPPDRRPRVLLSVAHGGGPAVEGAADHAQAVAESSPVPDGREPSGDDLVFLYTGGTTGMPKAVMWRSDDLYRAIWQSAKPGTEPPAVEDVLARGRASATALPACPLMHGTGLFTALNTLAGGGKLVLLDRAHLDPVAIWDAVEREQVNLLTIVGDAFGRPLLGALDDEPGRWDLRSLAAIMSSGVTWSPECKQGLLRHLPAVLLIDSLGASEGLITRAETRAGDDVRPARFRLSDRMVVVTDDGGLAEPGDGRVGLLGVGGPVPLGYYKDPDKTATTFRTVAGRRYSIPGDYATVEADGTITLLGRGSACINSGGEKVYPEEVELALRAHPAVFDAVVVGVPDERWGEMVVALVAPAPGAAPTATQLHDWCRERLAGYKTPKRFVLRDSLSRSPSGKADYRLLREVAAAAVGSEER